MKMTYRARRRLRRFGTIVLWLLLIALVVGTCWFVWLGRFVVYDDEGAHLRFDYESPAGEVQVAQPPEQETVAIHYNEGEEYVNNSSELSRICGYYATTSMLGDNLEGVKTAISALPEGSTVMLDLKSVFGNFYYSTTLPEAPVTDQIDVTEVDELIKTLTAADTYVIVRVPAFRDRAYGLANTAYGLPTAEGYLWEDENHCYWLNPAKNGTVNWLISIANELRALGADEVVFTEFKFPETDAIVFDASADRQAILEEAAQTLVSTCSTSRFAVSFETDNPAFVLPEGRSRLYLTGVDAAQVNAVAESTTVADKAVNLVYLTDTNDTRFDAFGTMRPMRIEN